MQQKAIEPVVTSAEPKITQHLLGREKHVAMFVKAFLRSGCPQSWMFYGAEGIGKATLAYQLARFILAEDQRAMTEVHHPVFRQVASGAHPDLLVIERQQDEKTQRHAAEIKIESMRELKSFLALTPSVSKHRVVLIDGVDYLNKNAMNALLKSLEEPPVTTYFLLVCHRKDRVLPTVLSRCLLVPVQPLRVEEAQHVLGGLLSDVSEEEKAILSHYACGSPGVAVTLMQYYAPQIIPQLAVLLAQVPSLSMKDVHQMLEQLSKVKKEHMHLQVLYMLYILLVRVIRASQMNDLLPFERSLAQSQLMQLPRPVLLKIVEELSLTLSNTATAHRDMRMLVLYFFEQINRLGA